MNEELQSSNCFRLAVVGGGISGLTAAYRLSKLLPTARIDLYEASDRLGGVLCSHSVDDRVVELGADSFIDKLPAAIELCRELGLEDQILPTNEEHRRALVLVDGKLHPVPAGFVQMRPEKISSMLTSPILSWRGKLRLLAERWVAKADSVDAAEYDESVASFATRRLGREVFERLVQPLLAGIYVADATKLSVAATMESAISAEREFGSLQQAVLAARAKGNSSSAASGARYARFVTLRGGLIKLIETLAQQFPDSTIHLNSPIQSITRSGDQRWNVTRANGHVSESYDGVVIALPAPRAAVLLQACDAELSRDLHSIPYASSAVVVLTYERDQISDPLEAFGIVIPAVEGRKVVAASYSSVKFPGRASEGQVVLRVFLGGALQPQLLELEDGDLVEIAEQEMADILGIEGKPLRVDLVRWREKMPQYHVGHLKLVSRIEQRVAALPTLEVAGNAYRGVGIPQCVKSGETAARKVAEELLRRAESSHSESD